MKKISYIILAVLISMFVMGWVSHGDWHLKRNKRNILPKGNLTQVEGKIYIDEAKLKWILQPNSKNLFHQPDKTPVPPIPIPYPNVSPKLKYDPDYPNLKFLSADGDGGSYEAILQADGTYLLTGQKQGTYNYSDPTGFMGYFKHIFLDVIPHFFTSDYDDSLNHLPQA